MEERGGEERQKLITSSEPCIFATEIQMFSEYEALMRFYHAVK